MANYAPPETPKSIRRDNRTLAVYFSMRCDRGRLAKVICRALRIPMRTLMGDLHYLAKGKLIEFRDGRWWRPVYVPDDPRLEHMKVWGNQRDRTVKLLNSTHKKNGVGTDECGVSGIW